MFYPAEFLNPVSVNKILPGENLSPHQVGAQISCLEYEPETPLSLPNSCQLVLIGVPEYRGAGKTNQDALKQVRKYYYRLIHIPKTIVCDLGDLKIGHTPNDTHFALRQVLEYLISNQKIPIILGGSADLAFTQFLAYEKSEQVVNMLSIDSAFRFGDSAAELSASNYLSKIIMHQPNYLFNYSNIGYQSYFVSPDETALMEKLFFDVNRLGVVRSAMQEAEPIIRNADFVSMDLSCIRQSEANATLHASPNGFFADEACQLARYAGFSDKLSSIGFYGYYAEKEENCHSAHLYAQLIWHFVDGFVSRKKDYPVADKSRYTKYTVSIKDGTNEIIFYKSQLSGRWWMDIPYPEHKNIQFKRQLLVPCSYQDYEIACKDEIPDRWWQTYQKLK